MSSTTASVQCLQNARISPEVAQLRPDYRALLVIIENIPPGGSDAQSEALLVEAESTAKTLLAAATVTELPHISAWREAYKSFGAKPQKIRNSLESLTRRVDAGLPRVNRLTDIYNAISVKHQIPLGGEDLDQYSGAPFLIRAKGDEKFETKTGGEVTVEHPSKGEVVWCDDAGVTCRRWNWRQCPRTALTDDTKNALFVLDALSPVSDDALLVAGQELSEIFTGLSSEVKVSQQMLWATPI